MAEQKLLIGPQIRRLRQSLGLTQAVMATDLGISTSYLNLIERNQRPMSAKVLLKFAEVYDVSLSDFSPQRHVKIVQELREITRSSAYRTLGISADEIDDCVNASPKLMEALSGLYRRIQDITLQASLRADPMSVHNSAGEGEAANSPIESVREFISEHGNYFDDLDRAAEALSGTLKLQSHAPQIALSQRLEEAHGIRTRIVPADILPGKLSYYDPHNKRLNLSEVLPQSGRRFRIAYQLAMQECPDLIESYIASAILPHKNADTLCRVTLANYFAAALLMPYRNFHTQAVENHYDIELLSRRFDTSYEQTAHRLTTLQRKGRSGISFFFVRVDMAGNVSKRFSGGTFHFSKFGGACPLWNIHACFQTPGETLPQLIEMPDGTQYFSIARAVLRPGAAYGQRAQTVAIGLGCEITDAKKTVYANHELAAKPTPIGINCYLCERTNCQSRAHAPLNSALRFDERSRDLSIFRFEKN